MRPSRAQDAETARLDRHERFAARDAAQPAFAIAEKGEMPVAHPGEQCARFANVARIVTGALERQALGGLAQCDLHGMPVGACRARVGEVALDPACELLHRRRIDHAVDLDVLKRLEPLFANRRRIVAGQHPAQLAGAVAGHGEDGMREKMQAGAALGQRQSDRVDEERHVVTHHFDNGVDRAIAVLAARRIEDAHERAAAPPPRELEMRDCGRGEFGGIAHRQLGRGDVGVIRPQVRCDLHYAAWCTLHPGVGRDGGQEASVVRDRLRHRCCFRRFRSGRS